MFLVFEITKNLDLRKTFGVTNIFLKSRFVCTVDLTPNIYIPILYTLGFYVSKIAIAVIIINTSLSIEGHRE